MKNAISSFHITKSYITLFSLGIFLSGCTNSNSNNPMTPVTVATNTPVIASVTNAFTYVIMANNYTQNQDWALTFTSDSLVLAVVSSNYKSGSLYFSVTDSTNAAIFQDTLTTNSVTTLIQSGKGIPKHCTINCSAYTGNVTFTLSKNR
jgi:hypothetical protein